MSIPGIPEVARAVFERLIGEPLLDADQLRQQMTAYRQTIAVAAKENPFVDDILADEIAGLCGAMLDAVTDATSDEHRHAIQAAVRYFVTEQDAESDLAIGGLHEDAEVANAVAQHVGAPGRIDL